MEQRAKQSGKIQDESVAMELIKHDEKNKSKRTSLISSTRKKTALKEMRARVESAITRNHLLEQRDTQNEQDPKNITLWGVPLLPSTGHGGTDVVLLKFLKARGYRVKEAVEMLKNTLKWRRQYRADDILGERFSESEKAMCVSSRDKEGRPLMFFGVGLETEDEAELMRWRVQYLEKAIKELKFDAGRGGADSLVQITDFNNSPKAVVMETSSFSIKSYQLLQQHYPELIHRRIVINAPFWYYASQLVSSRKRSSKEQAEFVVARPSKEAKTLLKFVSPENLPVEYGGLKRENDEEFCQDDKALELIVKEYGRGLIKLPAHQVGVTVIWEVTVVGWDVLYKEEFMPEDEGSYKILLREEVKENSKKRSAGGDNTIRNWFYIREPGHIVITVDNDTVKRKRVFYRYRIKTTNVVQ